MAKNSKLAGLSSLETVRWRLAQVWFSLCGLIVVILIGQSVGGLYGNELPRVWGWALPNFLPTLAFMISVLATEALNPYDADQHFVRRNFYTLAMGLSLFYLGAMLLAILLQTLFQQLHAGTEGDTHERISQLEASNIWLGPLQGLVIGSLSILFFLKDGVQRKSMPRFGHGA